MPLSIVGVQHIAVEREQDPEIRRAIVHALPAAVVIDDVEQVTADIFIDGFQRWSVAGFTVVAGPLCQPSCT